VQNNIYRLMTVFSGRSESGQSRHQRRGTQATAAHIPGQTQGIPVEGKDFLP